MKTVKIVSKVGHRLSWANQNIGGVFELLEFQDIPERERKVCEIGQEDRHKLFHKSGPYHYSVVRPEQVEEVQKNLF